MDVETGFGGEAGFYAGFRADELHGRAAVAEAIGHAERGDRVSARTAAGY